MTSRSSRRAFLVLVALGSQTVGCNSAPSGDGAPGSSQSSGELCDRWISGAAARSLIANGGLLLDVRTASEFESGHLEGAKNIDVAELPHRMSEIPKEQHVVVYCQSGRRAHSAALLLEEKGYTVSEIGVQSQYSPTAPAGCGGT